MATVYGELPFKPEVSLTTSVGVFRDHRHEQGAVLDLPSDRRIPGIAAPQLALVEPDLDSCFAECTGDTFRSRGVLRSVTNKYGTGGIRVQPGLWRSRPRAIGLIRAVALSQVALSLIERQGCSRMPP